MAIVTFTSNLKADGSLTIPREAVEELGLHPGDAIKVQIETTNGAGSGADPDQAALQAKFERFFEELDTLTFEKPAMSDHFSAPSVSQEDQSAHQALQPFSGQFHSGKGNLSQNTGEQFTEIVAEKHRKQGLQE
jgi:antitoxin component of MazEF toxin-antitoxin module